MTLDVLEIFSQRLRLVAIDCELSGLQLRNPETFFEKLGLPPPSVWPPDLMDRAARSGEVRRVIGHTLLDLIASRRVLEKTGFEEEIIFFDEDEQLEVVRYGLNLR